jgi:hypothetical protein
VSLILPVCSSWKSINEKPTDIAANTSLLDLFKPDIFHFFRMHIDNLEINRVALK